MSYKINQIFSSVQGERPDVGRAALFLRFSGCNFNCPFCDTDHSKANFEYESPRDLFDAVDQMSDIRLIGLRLVLTGGEPLLQIDSFLIEEALKRGMKLCLETNGSLEACKESPLGDKLYRFMVEYFDTVTVSPKSRSVDYSLLRAATCLKVVWPSEESKFSITDLEVLSLNLGQQRITWRHGESLWRVLQARTVYKEDQTVDIDGTQKNFGRAVLKELELRKAGYEWRALPQMHVFMDVM